jgi:hypothetical protein
MNNDVIEALMKFLVFFVIGIGLAFLFAWVIMLLWNAVIPTVFGLPEITYWQSFGLKILTRLLFNSHLKFENKKQI